MKVIVIGAGIGGLTLAQALHRADDRVRVHDRDPEASATGGYRLHLDDTACTVLRRHLPDDVRRAVWASSAGAAAFRQFAVTDHRLRPLVIAAQDPAVERLLIGRVPLRRLLAHGLDDVVQFNSVFTRHETHLDGTVTVHFADGTSETADLLVGADGVGSKVAQTATDHRPMTCRPRAGNPRWCGD